MAARKPSPKKADCVHEHLTYNNGALICVDCGARVAG